MLLVHTEISLQDTNSRWSKEKDIFLFTVSCYIIWFIRQFLIFRMSKDINRKRESPNIPEKIAKKNPKWIQASVDWNFFIKIFYQSDWLANSCKFRICSSGIDCWIRWIRYITYYLTISDESEPSWLES